MCLALKDLDYQVGVVVGVVDDLSEVRNFPRRHPEGITVRAMGICCLHRRGRMVLRFLRLTCPRRRESR